MKMEMKLAHCTVNLGGLVVKPSVAALR